jgi:hypothetical protein
MTPQERDLINALIDRLREQADQPKGPEAGALIRRAVTTAAVSTRSGGEREGCVYPGSVMPRL